MRRGWLTLFFLGSLGWFLLGQASSQPGGRDALSSTPKRSSSAIALTADGDTLLAVNPDSDSLTLIDAASLAVKAEIRVGVTPRTVAVNDAGNRAYVANWGSDTISIVDVVTLQTVGEIAVGHRPYGVVVSPDGERLYITEQGSHRLRIVDTASGSTIGTVTVAARPSGVALNPDGEELYITHLLDNGITVYHTLRPYVSHIPLIFNTSAESGQGFGKRSVSSGEPRFQPEISTTALWPDSNLVQSIVIGHEGRTAYVPHTRSNSNNRALTFDTTVFPLVSLIDLETGQHLAGQQLALGTLDPPGVGLPFDAAITPDGSELWVVNAASNDITVINLLTRQRAAHIEVDDNPRGIVLAPDGATAYVNNTLAGTVSVIETATYSVTETVTTTESPLPPLLMEGKRLFHSSDEPRLSKDQWVACNTCHFEGEHDGRTWFFGFAGPRNTTSLLGMIQTYPLRWSGEWDESADSEFAIRKENFGEGLVDDLHCALSPPDCVNQPPNQGRDDGLDALAAFIDSLQMPLSPNHAANEPLSGRERRGRALFNEAALGCAVCHPAPFYTDQKKHDVGTVTEDEKIGPAYDTPSLRGLHSSAPYFHDGSARTLYEALTRPTANGEHDVRSLLTEGEIQDLVWFLRALPFEE